MNELIKLQKVMDFLSNSNSYDAWTAWYTFWAVYWLLESIFPYDEKSDRIVPSASVPLTVFRNMLISLPFGIILWNIVPNISDFLPTSYITRFLFCLIVMDGWFYFAHRLLHTPKFYKWHKQHHQYNIPHPLMAVYCSPFEALLCDTTSMGLPPMLLRMTGLELQVWMIWAALHTLLIHSSLSHGKEHNIHHGKNNGNYGLLSLFDRIFGTHKT